MFPKASSGYPEPLKIFAKAHVDTVQVPLMVFWHYTCFSGSLSSLDITNGNRSHNKPLELI